MKGYMPIVTGWLMFAIASLMALPISYAEIMEGHAAIVNGDVETARAEAKKDAMRSFIEKEVGVYVKSETEVADGMVVRDQIMTNTDGYVQVNRVVKEWQSGNVYSISLDLSANARKFETAVENLQSALENLDENSSRYGVQVAVTGRNESGQPESAESLRKYVQAKLESVGFQTFANDAVLQQMNAASDLESPQLSAELRRIARNNREEGNSLLRGTLTTISVSKEGQYTEATVRAAFELIGLDSSASNSFADYFTAVGKDRNEALRKANDMATQKAVEALGQKALKTAQSENRGGVHHIKTTLVFSGITDRANQPNAIVQGLAAAKCRVIRRSFAGDGTYRVFVEAAYDTTSDLQTAVLAAISGLAEGNKDESAVGSEKLYFTF